MTTLSEATMTGIDNESLLYRTYKSQDDDEGDGRPPKSPNTLKNEEEAMVKMPIPMRLGYLETVGLNGRDLTFKLHERGVNVKLTKLYSGEDCIQSVHPVNVRYITLNLKQCRVLVDDIETVREATRLMLEGDPVEYRLYLDSAVHVVFESSGEMCNLRRYYKRVGVEGYAKTASGVQMYAHEAERVWTLIEEAIPFMVPAEKRVLLSKRKKSCCDEDLPQSSSSSGEIIPEGCISKYFIKNEK